MVDTLSSITRKVLLNDDIAKKMSLKDISEVVNLPIDEVKRIINDFKTEKE